jgi:transcriptional regulator with XRE-family HTH domain
VPRPREVLGENVRRLRRDREWSQADLAARLTELGYPMTQAMIAKIESVRTDRATNDVRAARSVSVDELVALAYALDTSPTNLLVPWPSDAAVNLVRGVSISGAKGRRWFRGWEPAPGQDAQRYRRIVPDQDRIFLQDPHLPSLIDTLESESLAALDIVDASAEQRAQNARDMGAIAWGAHVARIFDPEDED